jgi:hypothetical protein
MQLEHWGLDYFDLFLVHFPVALAYVDPVHRYPPEWWGDDGRSVNLRKRYIFPFAAFQGSCVDCAIRKHTIPGDMARHGRASRRGTGKEHRR